MHKHYNDEVIDRRKHLTWTTVAVVGGLALAGGMAYGASQNKQKSSFTAPQIETPSEDTAKLAAEETIKRKRIAAARNKTVFTGPLGLTNADQSNLATKTLLGQ